MNWKLNEIALCIYYFTNQINSFYSICIYSLRSFGQAQSNTTTNSRCVHLSTINTFRFWVDRYVQFHKIAYKNPIMISCHFNKKMSFSNCVICALCLHHHHHHTALLVQKCVSKEVPWGFSLTLYSSSPFLFDRWSSIHRYDHNNDGNDHGVSTLGQINKYLAIWQSCNTPKINKLKNKEQCRTAGGEPNGKYYLFLEKTFIYDSFSSIGLLFLATQSKMINLCRWNLSQKLVKIDTHTVCSVINITN